MANELSDLPLSRQEISEIKADLDAQGFSRFQFLLQVFNLDDFFRTPRDQLKGLFYIRHISVRVLPVFLQ